MCDELYETTRALLEGLTSRSNGLEVHGSGRARCDSIDLPGRRLADTDLRFTDTSRFLTSRNGVANETGDFELLRRLRELSVISMEDIRLSCDLPYLNVESGVEAHLQLPLIILVEHAQEALLEDGSREGVREHNDTICRVGEGLHLQ